MPSVSSWTHSVVWQLFVVIFIRPFRLRYSWGKAIAHLVSIISGARLTVKEESGGQYPPIPAWQVRLCSAAETIGSERMAPGEQDADEPW
jgi:hypothetical protein